MSSQYCTTYGCGRQTSDKLMGKPYCQPCINQYQRGLSIAANDILKELSTLRNAIIRIGLGGEE